MSHYALAVFCDRPDRESFYELLKPYDENNEEYFVFEPVPEDELKRKWEKFHKQNPSWEPKYWLNEMFHYDEKSGLIGHWSNPKGYYDYCTFNGRDCGAPLKKNAARKVRLMKSDYEWMKPEDKMEADEYAKEWDHHCKFGDGWYSPSYFQDNYGSKEQYVKEMLRPWTPYAFVTPDGEWHAPGTVGWFAVSDDTFETRDKYWQEWCDFINNGHDCYVSIFDCHI